MRPTPSEFASRRLRRAVLIASAGLVALAAAGCKPYRIEHYERPGFYYQASEGELVDEWIAPDGTVVKFSSPPTLADALEKQAVGGKREVDADGDGQPDSAEPTPIWEESEDGKLKLRAFLPQHVLGNFMEAVRVERYDDFYDQLVAQRTRDNLDAQYQGQGRKAFARWCAKNRSKLMEMLNRMNFEYMSSDVVLRKVGSDGYRIGFTPRVGALFKFDTVDVVYEQGSAKLIGIH